MSDQPDDDLGRRARVLSIAASRLVTLAALAVCGALLADYSLNAQPYCGFTHGCDEVVFSDYGRPLGIPLPVAGLAAFGTFYLLTFARGRRAASARTAAAIAAGCCGLALFAVQAFALGRFCPLCLAADIAAMGLAITALATPEAAASAPAESRRGRAAWLTAALLAAAAPVGWARLRPPPPVPARVQALWLDGKVNVVEATDFDCRHCRELHGVMEAFLRSHADHVRFARIVVPAPHHANARPAALAYLAAEAQGRGETMAGGLYAADDLSAAGCRRIAASLGLDLARYDAVVADPAAVARLDAAVAWGEAEGFKGLPVVWVGEHRFDGAPTAELLNAAFRRAQLTEARR